MSTHAQTIDGKLSEIYGAIAQHRARIDNARRYAERYPAQAEYYLRHLAEDTAKLDAAREARDELEAEYTGWSRFFLVTNANGHIHDSTSCSTTYATTSYAWLTDMSGLTEADAVAAHGERLCSVCFPTAPVEWRDSYYVKQAEAARAERTAKAAAKAAAEVKVEGFRDNGRVKVKVFKTERGAELEAMAGLDSAYFYADEDGNHPWHDEWMHNARVIAEALAERRGTDADEILDGWHAKKVKKYKKTIV